MILILDGKSKKGAHVWMDLGYLICLMHLIRTRTVTSLIIFQKDPSSLHLRNMLSWLDPNSDL